jgi:hypothetical protein
MIGCFYFNEYFQNQLDFKKDKKLLINQMNEWIELNLKWIKKRKKEEWVLGRLN